MGASWGISPESRKGKRDSKGWWGGGREGGWRGRERKGEREGGICSLCSRVCDVWNEEKRGVGRMKVCLCPPPLCGLASQYSRELGTFSHELIINLHLQLHTVFH